MSARLSTVNLAACLCLVVSASSCGKREAPALRLAESEKNASSPGNSATEATRPGVNPVKFNLGLAALAFESRDYSKCEECCKKAQEAIERAFSPFMTADGQLAERILQHPSLQWKALNVRQHRGSRG